MIMPMRREGCEGDTGDPLDRHVAGTRAIAFAARVNRVGIDDAIACADGAVSLSPCSAACTKPCARSRRQLRALLVAIGLSGREPS
jgi:hypothetical protein